MTREEKQFRLKSINNAICAITLTYDMGVQIDYISARGAQESMGSYSQWPCLHMRITDTLRSLQKRLIDGEKVSDEDMLADSVCSEICTFHDLYFNTEVRAEGELLKHCLGLIREKLPTVELGGNDIYAYAALEEWHTQIELFSTYESLFSFFIDLWDSGAEAFEDMIDEDIDFWYQLAEDHDWDDELTLMSIKND